MLTPPVCERPIPSARGLGLTHGSSACLIGAVLVCLGVGGWLPQQAIAGRPCGTTTVGETVLKVSADKRTLCRSARRLAKSFFSRRGWTEHGGPYNYQRHWTSRSYPGWKCGIGAAAGFCSKRVTQSTRSVSYEIPPSG